MLFYITNNYNGYILIDNNKYWGYYERHGFDDIEFIRNNWKEYDVLKDYLKSKKISYNEDIRFGGDEKS